MHAITSPTPDTFSRVVVCGISESASAVEVLSSASSAEGIIDQMTWQKSSLFLMALWLVLPGRSRISLGVLYI